MNFFDSRIEYVKEKLIGERFGSLGSNCAFAWLTFGTLDSPATSTMRLRSGKVITNFISDRYVFHIQCTFYYVDNSENVIELDWRSDKSIFDRICSYCNGYSVDDVYIGEYNNDKYLAIKLDNGCEFEICIFEVDDESETWRLIDYSGKQSSHMVCYGSVIKGGESKNHDNLL